MNAPVHMGRGALSTSSPETKMGGFARQKLPAFLCVMHVEESNDEISKTDHR